ncbi:L-lactate dehydrogenase [Devosia lucknowensis]|uniref:L-lactate dehydrogenase n=1 Tax=Devosia lucknowensis TaxID=1096929 RepID=A0A1Y6G7N4_9HYPH|nr:Ldh family oxidoreductase [Devosia lucknowensis]SMQ85764.1 L-lactate dehydrogenase [Devosia lucknowensis]
MTENRFAAAELVAFARNALIAGGLGTAFAETTADVLVEGDLMGHTTHGLALLPAYLAALENGGMAREGSFDVLRDKQATALWDGRFLPGPWLITQGFALGVERARTFGTFTLSIRRSHHTASLVAYLKAVTDAGLMGILSVSDPTERCVAPAGGRAPLHSTNPIAFGLPTEEAPILVDISTSSTTNGLVKRLFASGGQLPHDWLVSAEGEASADPGVRFTDPPGAVLPLGGMDNGHKGFGLGILAEALTHGLSGHGRVIEPRGWQANVFIQVLDPEFFAGADVLRRELSHFADTAHAVPPIDPARPVRLPGERGLALRETQLREGMVLSPAIVEGLAPWAEKYGLPLSGLRA